MKTKSITIRVNADVAEIFESASEEQRRKLEALLSLKLGEVTEKEETSRNANERDWPERPGKRINARNFGLALKLCVKIATF